MKSGHDLTTLRTLTLLFGFMCLVAAAPTVADIPDPATDAPTEDEDVPYGVASSWLLGRQLLVEGKTEDALPYLHFAYRAQPGEPVIAMTFQEALADGGYLRDALEVMDSLVAAWPDSQSYRLRRSSLNLQAGHRDKALEDLQKIRENGSASPEILAAEGTLLAAAGQPDGALGVFREGLELFPGSRPRFYLSMASILQQEGKLSQVPLLMQEAVTAEPDSPALWLVRIRALAALDDFEGARAIVIEATGQFAPFVASEPDSVTVALMSENGGPVPDSHEFFYIELADYYAQHGELSRAVDLLQPLSESEELGLSPSLWLGRLYLGAGRVEEAAALVGTILERWPDSGRAWFLRGKISEGQDDWAGAVPHYRKAAGLAAYDAEIRLGLVRALLVTGEREGSLRGAAADSSRADLKRHAMVASMIAPDGDAEGQLILGYAFLTLEDFERGSYRFELAGENPDLRIAALTQMSICLDHLDRQGKARGALELLRREYPDDPEVANSLGYYLAEKGEDLELAEKLIREALEVEPGNGAYLDSLGWVYYRLGRYEEALDQLIRAVNVLPEDPVILEHVGLTLLELGQQREALDILVRAAVLGGDAERLDPVIDKLRAVLGEAGQD